LFPDKVAMLRKVNIKTGNERLFFGDLQQ